MKRIFFVLLFCEYAFGNSSQVYLDYAASTDIGEKSLEEFNKVSKLNGNSSGFNSHAQQLKKIEKKSAEIIAKKLGCKSDQILFTNSATISNNIAILGVAYKYPKCHLITSKIEHKSVLNVFKYLENEGYKVTYLNVDRYGYVNLEELKKCITPETRLVSIQSFNSEIGAQQNLKAISDALKRYKPLVFHSDISQSFGKYPLDINCLDMATFSGYKIGAPKGIAALYIKDREGLSPIFFGSGDKLFPGSKPTALIAAFAKAVETYKFNTEIIKNNFYALQNEVKKIEGVFINSKEPSHVFSVSVRGVLLKNLIDRLKNYSFSSGCSCLGQGESNVKQAIDPDGKIPSCTLRISFSDKVHPQTLIDFARNLRIEIKKLRKEKSVSDSCEKTEDSSELSKAIQNLGDL